MCGAVGYAKATSRTCRRVASGRPRRRVNCGVCGGGGVRWHHVSTSICPLTGNSFRPSSANASIGGTRFVTPRIARAARLALASDATGWPAMEQPIPPKTIEKMHTIASDPFRSHLAACARKRAGLDSPSNWCVAAGSLAIASAASHER
eukprot:7391151-Prymnesium_polylepis.1